MKKGTLLAMKRFFRIIFSRVLYIAVFVSVQLAALAVMFLFFHEQFAYFYAACTLLSLLFTLYVINSDRNPAYKIAWLIPLLVVPIFGAPIFLIFGNVRLKRKESKNALESFQQFRASQEDQGAGLDALRQEYPQAARQAAYIQNAGFVPPYGRTETEYFPQGEDFFQDLCQELESAKRFIFLEYFIIEEGVMWNAILNILERKVKEGVDVRVMYDDMGVLFKLPQHYDWELRRRGLKACVFNPFHSILSSRFNNRDHRKICVVDGNVGYTGGINLADEYINAVELHGHWKDTAVRLRGDAVWSLTTAFLSVWDFISGDVDNFADYAGDPAVLDAISHDGFVQTYTDLPMDTENVGENVYLNLLGCARDYVYITSPYLILDNETITALQNAAKSGVDVRIITPHVPDKKTVFQMTRSYYPPLLRDGVRIYEYSPGFIHAKNFVSDDTYAVVGTVNLDYRSLFLHFECAAWMCGSKAVGQVKEDFLQTLEKCEEITADSMEKLGFFRRLILSILRVFAPLV